METVENPTLLKERNLSVPQAWWQTRRAAQVGTVVLVLALLGTVAWWFLFRPFVTTDDARVAMTLVRISPSNVSGRIEKVNVEEGSRVKAGDVLVEIDHRIPQANFDRARARAVLAERELGRLQKLTQQGSATPQALDQAKANDATAKVEMTLAQVALENTYLRSPFNGIVIQKLAEVGNLLEQNQTALVVADEDHAWIAANIEETAIGDVRVGQPVEITIDEGGKLHGKITEIRASVASQFALIPSDSGAGNYTKVVQRVPVRITLENSEHRPLRAGQSVEIKVRIH
jgi:membrane fusion protein (multidrug efflux system)